MTFLFQINADGTMWSDTCIILNSVKDHNLNISNNEQPYNIFFTYDFLSYFSDILFSNKFDELYNIDVNIDDIIPVGTIEFVEQFRKITNNKNVSVPCFGIPNELMKSEFLCRQAVYVSHANFQIAIDMMKLKRVFIKDCSKNKSMVDVIETWDRNKLYEFNEKCHSKRVLVSEYVEPKSEWRYFVLNGVVRGVRNYSGDFHYIPDYNAVKNMITAFSSKNEYAKAYTLDVMVIQDGNDLKTAIVEAHPFVSCGLYGFEDPCISLMSTLGYKSIDAYYEDKDLMLKKILSEPKEEDY